MPDVLSCLKSRFPDFKSYLSDNPEYVVIVSGKDKANPRQLHPEFIATPFQDCEEVHLFSATKGAGIEAALVSWGFSAAAASFISTVVINLAISLVIGAVTRMLAPKVENKGSERPEERPSFLYNGPENVIQQGYQVPIVYGVHMTGSVVVSAGVAVEQIAVGSTRTDPPSGVGAAVAAAVPWQWAGETP